MRKKGLEREGAGGPIYRKHNLTSDMPPDSHRIPTASRNGVDPYTAWARWIGTEWRAEGSEGWILGLNQDRRRRASD